MRRVGSCAVVAACILARVPAVSAQGRAEVAVSYDFLYHEYEETSAAGMHVGAAVPIAHFKGVVEAGVNRFDGATVSSFMGGARWRLGRGSSAKLEPSVQALIGAWRCCEETNVAFQPGLLLDYRYSSKVAIRGGLALRHIFVSDFDDENAFRLSAGVVWSLSR